MRVYALIWIFLSLLCLSCRGGVDFLSTHISDDDGEEFVRIRYGTPIYYTLADPDCTEADALDNLGLMKVWLSKNENVELVDVDLSGFSGRGLQHKLIEDTLIGYKQKYFFNCDSRQERKICESPLANIIDEGARLNFCRKGGAYPRESLENVALASLTGIAFIFRLHEKVFPDDEIPKLTLLIHPEILDERRTIGTTLNVRKEVIRTDNAFWFQNSGKNYIAAFPGSKERKQAPEVGKEWELPSVMAHEWGHNLFSHYAPSLVDPLGSDGQNGFVQPSQRIDLSTSALNEGFADLTAYLAFESEFPDLGWYKLRGVYFNRNVSSSRFDNGSKKVIDNWLLHHYFQESDHLNFQSPSPDPTDDHTVGAIIAHGLYRLFKPFLFVRADVSKTLIENTYKKAVMWAQRMERSFVEDQGQSAVNFLHRAIAHAVAVEKETRSVLSSNQCKTIRNVFMSFLQKPNDCLEDGEAPDGP